MRARSSRLPFPSDDPSCTITVRITIHACNHILFAHPRVSTPRLVRPRPPRPLPSLGDVLTFYPEWRPTSPIRTHRLPRRLPRATPRARRSNRAGTPSRVSEADSLDARVTPRAIDARTIASTNSIDGASCDVRALPSAMRVETEDANVPTVTVGLSEESDGMKGRETPGRGRGNRRSSHAVAKSFDRRWVKIDGVEYDVTDFKHPGGSVIYYMLSNTGATRRRRSRSFIIGRKRRERRWRVAQRSEGRVAGGRRGYVEGFREMAQRFGARGFL